MPKEPLINLSNAYVMINMFFQATAFFIPPLFIAGSVLTVISLAMSYCSPGDYTALPRAGAIIQGVTFFYVFFEELWRGPEFLAEEIEASFAQHDLDNRPSSTAALKKYRDFSSFTIAVHRGFVRFIEAMLVLLGTILSAFGDLIGPYMHFAGF